MPVHGLRSQVALASVLLAFSVSAATAAQRAVPVERQGAPAAQAAPMVEQDLDAKETRQQLDELLRRLPPAVGRVLRTDPSLLANDAYLSTYPGLATFIKQHPEIRNSPAFFFEHVNGGE